ncbi:MAG: class I SAM-dependent methyltransferase [Blastocatellia bacterium]
MNQHLTQMLRCPITKNSLTELSAEEVKEANSRITKGDLLHFDGTLVTREIRSALISSDGQYVYRVEDGVFVLLQNLAIAFNKRMPDGAVAGLRGEKQNVQSFYDEVGWRKRGGGDFIDAQRYEDLRPVSKEYVEGCRMRVNNYLKPRGRFILDVASGPIQFPEYLSYSSNFDTRICVDLSVAALREAQRKLGDKGVYLLADITNLPIKDDAVDAAISLHTIYHVPKDEQSKAFHEIHRVLAPGSSAVVVYSWGPRSPLMNMLLFPIPIIRATRAAAKRLANLKGKDFKPKLYAHMHDYRWFAEQKWGFDFDIVAWRSLSHHFSKVYVHRWLFGRQILKLFFWLEKSFPNAIGRIGQYPLLVLKKH